MSKKRINGHSGDPIDSRVLRANYDDLVGVLRDRSWRLDSRQRDMLWLILDQGASYGQLARLSGEHASTVSRRFRAMVRRLRGRPGRKRPTPRTLTSLEKIILIESFLCGTTQVQIAAKLGVSRYRVRKTLAPFKGTRP